MRTQKTDKKRKQELEEKNKLFLQLQKKYRKGNDQYALARMWLIAQECAKYTILKKLKGKVSYTDDQVFDKSLDAAKIVMRRIIEGTKDGKEWNVQSLPTCIYYAVISTLYGRENRSNDFNCQAMSLDELEETCSKESKVEPSYLDFYEDEFLDNTFNAVKDNDLSLRLFLSSLYNDKDIIDKIVKGKAFIASFSLFYNNSPFIYKL